MINQQSAHRSWHFPKGVSCYTYISNHSLLTIHVGLLYIINYSVKYKIQKALLLINRNRDFYPKRKYNNYFVVWIISKKYIIQGVLI